MESALTIEPPPARTRSSARADLPEAVGPAMRTTSIAKRPALPNRLPISRDVLYGNPHLRSAPARAHHGAGARRDGLAADGSLAAVARTRRCDPIVIPARPGRPEADRRGRAGFSHRARRRGPRQARRGAG